MCEDGKWGVCTMLSSTEFSSTGPTSSSASKVDLGIFPNSCTEGIYKRGRAERGDRLLPCGQGQEKKDCSLRATITTASVRLDHWADSRRLHHVHLDGNRSPP